MFRRLCPILLAVIIVFWVLLILNSDQLVLNGHFRFRKLLENHNKVHPNAKNSSAHINRIIDAQRQLLKYEIQRLSVVMPTTNASPVKSSKKSVKRCFEKIIFLNSKFISVILSTWQSGTTLLGDILNAVPGNYYHYEPLMNYTTHRIRESPESDVAINTLRELLNCNYTSLTEYLDFGKKFNNLFPHNKRLWHECEYNPQLCFQTNFLNRFCRLFPFQSMKVVRLQLSLAEPLLDDTLNTKMVYLTRDPREVMHLRRSRDWCSGDTKVYLYCISFVLKLILFE